MNVKLIQNEIACYELALHTALAREETLEMIVPDACPDLLDIADTDAVVSLRGKECAEGCITLHGSVLCTVLYQPENGTALQPLHAELPIQFTAELQQITGRSQCILQPRVTLAETRAINPRKVLIRVNVLFELTAYEPTALLCCSGLEEREALGVEQRLEQQRGSLVIHVSERPFTYSDEVQIPGSRPPMKELLRVRSHAFCSETRLIGGKLVFKGGTAIQIFYLSQEDQLCTAEFELPFSQIAEVGEEAEENQLYLTVQSCQCAQLDQEGRGISVELELLAQLVIRKDQELSVVTDAYSIRYPGTPEFRAYLLPQLIEHGKRRQTARELIETPTAAQAVCDARVLVGQVKSAPGEVSAEVRLVVLYLTETGSYAQATRQLSISCPVDAREGVLCLAECAVSELDAAAIAGGIEVRFGMDFQVLVLRQERCYALSAFAVDTEQSVEQEHQPSIVLRQLTEGETLWEIAKTYMTTQAEIEQANGLSADQAAPGQMLLIPRKR